MPENPNAKFVKELFDAYRQMMFKTALSILHNKTDAEEAVSDAFLWIINNLDKISHIPCNERAFYFTSVIEHISIDFLRKRKRHPSENIDEHWDIASDCWVEEEVSEKVTVEEIKKALKELSDRDYSIMYLYAFKQMKPKEIAAELGIPEENIRVYIKRARERLIKILKERGIDYDI